MLVSSYMRICGIDERERRIVNTTDSGHKGIGAVLDKFSEELNACRSRQKRARTLLIVIADADNYSVEARKGHLSDRSSFNDNDPLVLLIPKKHIETWVCSATGRSVAEADDCKSLKLKKGDFREAARKIHDWAHNDSSVDSTCVDSLRMALPEWRRIG